MAVLILDKSSPARYESAEQAQPNSRDMDFRSPAAETTFRRTRDSSGAALAQLHESGCIKVPGGSSLHRLIEIPFFVFTLGNFLAIMMVIVLRTLNMVSFSRGLVLSTILL